MVKEGRGKVTLAIGDGANDVSMIQGLQGCEHQHSKRARYNATRAKQVGGAHPVGRIGKGCKLKVRPTQRHQCLRRERGGGALVVEATP